MPFPATAIKVMIASPSDVSAERQIVREVIHEWNSVHAEGRGQVLLAVGWESHASPEMGDRPQEIINRQLLRDADMLVAVFWTRLGTPTGYAPSGTVEEIEFHVGSNRPALLYFSTASAPPDRLDIPQLEALRSFRESCRQRGLVETYSDLGEFRVKVARQLVQVVFQRFPAESEPKLESPQESFELSDAATELLVEASRDSQGVIVQSETMAGGSVGTNNRSFIQRGDARAHALWRGAVSELHRNGLIEDRVGKGQVFFLTDLGFRTVDLLTRPPES